MTTPSDFAAKVAELEPSDRAIAEAIHKLVGQLTPELEARTWYGMPAWALNGKTIIFFQSGIKFKTRYSTLGFSEHAKLDDGSAWPTSYALAKWDKDTEELIHHLIIKAVRGS